MVILALETATRAGSLALVAGPRVVARIGNTTRTHSERLPDELLGFLREHGHDVEDIDCLAVVAGPGSFTGLRIGIAAMQGIAMVARKPVVGIPTLDAMASAWVASNPGRPARLVACLDGARADVFFAAFDIPEGPQVELTQLIEPTVGSPVEAADRAARVPGQAPLILVGDAVARFREEFASRCPEAALEESTGNLALGAARLAAARIAQAGAPHALRPLYVRRPDAVLARERLRAASPPAQDDLTLGRATTPEELAGVAELQRRSFANAWGAEAIRWELDNSEVARLYTARTSVGLVAYCACWLVFDELHINSVAVEPSARRQGVARRVLEFVFRDAVEAGARGATLEVRQSNDAARALYEGLGFRVEGVRRNYYQNPREDGLILWHRDLAARFGGPR
jgi:tRNA threonylcarbamoyl adenosine modification protein YeaZ/ribosomal-protein-alanine acetyltransferase